MRGGAPATRELALLEPSRTVARVDSVVLSGGSAFGLATADGVMRFLVERGQGFPTAVGPVPIVPAACVFDLVEARGQPPGADDGYAARGGRGVAGDRPRGSRARGNRREVAGPGARGRRRLRSGRRSR